MVDVVIKNLEFQGLDKNVARQMITSEKIKFKWILKEGGGNIDFAVLWSYHHQSGLFRIQLIDDHIQTKYNMAEIAEKYVINQSFSQSWWISHMEIFLKTYTWYNGRITAFKFKTTLK